MKFQFRQKAIDLRSNGFSYSEIMEKIPVAKSTLSYWLHHEPITKAQKLALVQKRLRSAQKGALIRKQQRISHTFEIYEKSYAEVETITQREMWLLGIMLYWAEGAKAKPHTPSQGVIFSNSESKMVKLFVIWLVKSLKIDRRDITFEIYIHKSHKNRIIEIKNYWATETGFNIDQFGRIYYKSHNLSSNRKNVNDAYKGLVRVKVKKSTDLNRKITGWIVGICNNCGVV